MKNKLFLGMIVCVALAIGLVLTGCGKKDSETASGGNAPGTAKAQKNAAPASDFSYDLSADGQGIKITGYTGQGGRVVIPATIEDMPVVEIGENAFSGGDSSGEVNNRDAISSIVVPDTVVTLSYAAFACIDELTSVTLPDGLKVIPKVAFYDCPKLTTVNLPASLERIMDRAFNDCGELSNLIIPSGLTNVNFFGFDYALGLDSEKPDNGAFTGCGKLPLKTRAAIQGWGYTGGF
jgi:hypothetical protein